MMRPARSAFFAAALGLAVVLSACTGQGNDPATETATSSSPTPSSSPAALTTFAGAWEDVQYAFDFPSNWTIEETDPAAGSGYVTVMGPRGEELASLDILVAWGMSCMQDGCPEQPVVYLGDWVGQYPLSITGTVAARSIAMDLSENPSEQAKNEWPDSVRVVTSLTASAEPPQSTMAPSLMYGRVQVETGAAAANGGTQRTVLFISNRDFGTLQEAKTYTGSDEHRQIQAMIASFREE